MGVWAGRQCYSWFLSFQKQEEGVQLYAVPHPSSEPFRFNFCGTELLALVGRGEVMAWETCCSRNLTPDFWAPYPFRHWPSTADPASCIHSPCSPAGPVFSSSLLSGKLSPWVSYLPKRH